MTRCCCVPGMPLFVDRQPVRCVRRRATEGPPDLYINSSYQLAVVTMKSQYCVSGLSDAVVIYGSCHSKITLPGPTTLQTPPSATRDITGKARDCRKDVCPQNWPLTLTTKLSHLWEHHVIASREPSFGNLLDSWRTGPTNK